MPTHDHNEMNSSRMLINDRASPVSAKKLKSALKNSMGKSLSQPPKARRKKSIDSENDGTASKGQKRVTISQNDSASAKMSASPPI